MEKPEPTINDVMNTVNDAKDTVNTVLGAIADFAETTEKRFNKIESDITTIKTTMVTKEYLDRKLTDFRGDVVVKVDTKDTALVHVLKRKKVISASECDEIVAMSPFPRLVV